MIEKIGETCNSQQVDLGKLSSYLPWLSSNPELWLCSSVEPNPECTLTRELSEVQICLIQILKQGSLKTLEPHLSLPRQGAKSQFHPLWRVF